MLIGPWQERDLLRCCRDVLGWTANDCHKRLVDELFGLEPPDEPPPYQILKHHLLWSNAFAIALQGDVFVQPKPRNLRPPQFRPAPLFRDLDIPRLTTSARLAAWLDLKIPQLDWLADRRDLNSRSTDTNLQHYAHAFVPKASGPPRLVEQPKPRLKAIQRKILHEILDKVPVHPRCHGFVAGRSVLTAAAIHAGEQLIIATDLKDFFLTTPVGRVHALFRELGYPLPVARLLTGLVTTTTPASVFERLPDAQRHSWQVRQLFGAPHLPQGAPTSPALANLAAFNHDARLDGLARAFGANYTRYADDLAFSGDESLARTASRLIDAVAEIAKDEGYRLNPAKTRILPRHQRQRLLGVVVNDHVNLPRDHFDALKATLHNCRKGNPQAQNRDGHANFRAHLEGRVAWAEGVNPARGMKLRAILEQVRWT